MTDQITTLSLAAASGAAGVFSGGWFVRFLFQRFFDRANTDHDDIVRLIERMKTAEKDINALHEKLRALESKGVKID